MCSSDLTPLLTLDRSRFISLTVFWSPSSKAWRVGSATYGRSIHEARERIREALGLFVREAGRARLSDDIRLPAGVRSLLARQREARSRAEREQQRARAVVSRAVVALTEELGLSVRDAGELLGISHQRVQQLREGAATRVA